METVYIIGIVAVAVVIVVVVWLLRDRITGGRFGASATEQKVEAEITAASPKEEAANPLPTPPPPEKSPAVDISDNVMIGGQVVRVWRNSVRLARNWLWGQQRIELKNEAPPPPSKSKKRKTKKRKK